MVPELFLPTISAALFVIGIVGIALCVDYYVGRKWLIDEEEVK